MAHIPWSRFPSESVILACTLSESPSATSMQLFQNWVKAWSPKGAFKTQYILLWCFGRCLMVPIAVQKSPFPKSLFVLQVSTCSVREGIIVLQAGSSPGQIQELHPSASPSQRMVLPCAASTPPQQPGRQSSSSLLCQSGRNFSNIRLVLNTQHCTLLHSSSKHRKQFRLRACTTPHASYHADFVRNRGLDQSFLLVCFWALAWTLHS